MKPENQGADQQQNSADQSADQQQINADQCADQPADQEQITLHISSDQQQISTDKQQLRVQISLQTINKSVCRLVQIK